MAIHTKIKLLVGGICRAQFWNIYQRPKDPTTKSRITEVQARSGVSDRVPIGESFNGASLSKIVSMYDRICSTTRWYSRGKVAREANWTRRETGAERMAGGLRLLIRRLADPELFPAAARARLPPTIIVATRCETPEETHATARLRRAKSEKRINSAFSTRCPGYSARAMDELNAASVRVCEIRVSSER